MPPSAVLNLDEESFPGTLKANPLMMVMFYAPWCGHSRALEPHFEQAAQALQGSVAFARVDANSEVELASAFGVGAYPTIFLLKQGGAEEFQGRRLASNIVEWVREKVGPAVKAVASQADLDKELAQRGVLAGFVASGSTAFQTMWTSIAEKNRALGQFFFLDPAHDGGNKIVLHRGLDEILELASSENADLAENQALSFLKENLLASFGQIGEENFLQYSTSGADGIVWALFAGSGAKQGGGCEADDCVNQARANAETFHQIAVAFRKLRVVFVDVVKYKDYVKDELGVTCFPAVMLQHGKLSGEKDTEVFRYTLHAKDGMTFDAISSWLQQVLSGAIKHDDALTAEGSGLSCPA
eukprot:TRINITY_DN32777_c0_g1_i1.p1 TRINITY_DN32777_c0_g1~~TRINITY_DN32777_c0_g1_i1.p1  ORF type:complete len:392 (+),score=105.41 TRINITY_DN32777_c0_g1_i1:109-1176(+)